MYKTLLKLKELYKREHWLKMVDQAKERGKLTEEEYEQLVNENSYA